MNRLFRRCCLFVFFGWVGAAWGAQPVEILHMQEMEPPVAELAKTHGAPAVLIVFDIDNTLLAMDQALGSDQWFGWQESQLFSQAGDQRGRVASNFEGLLKVQGLLYSLQSMSPPEYRTVELIRYFQDQGHPVLALTSRGHEFRYATLRELLRNGINLSKTAFSEVKKFKGPTPAYDPQTVLRTYHFPVSKQKDLKLDQGARDVVYADGIFFTAGQHKGVMLKILLKEAGADPKAIVFVDDHVKHVQRIQAVFGEEGVNLITFRYGFEDKKVLAFQASDKTDVIRQWERLKTKLDNEGLASKANWLSRAISYFRTSLNRVTR